MHSLGKALEDLQDLLELTSKKEILFIIGDWNAKVGSQEIPGVTGKFGLGVQNEERQRLIEFRQEMDGELVRNQRRKASGLFLAARRDRAWGRPVWGESKLGTPPCRGLSSQPLNKNRKAPHCQIFLLKSTTVQSKVPMMGKVLAAQPCPTPCSPVDCIPPGACIHGISWERILEGVYIPFLEVPFQPRDRTWVSCIPGRLLTT